MLFSKIIEKKFAAVLGRYDGDPAIRYWSLNDFPGLKAESYDLQGDHDITLKGYFYYYNEFNPKNLIVFDHGIGQGHLAYLKEIDYLAKHNYTVYAYDHTGCAATQGVGIQGFAQGINDLDHVLTALKNDERFKGLPLKLIGHSWGGYACMNVASLHSEVSHIVSLAGFLSAQTLVEQYIPKPFLKYSKEVMERERQHNPKYTDMDARDSLKKTDAKLLYLQSKDDTKVKFELGTEPLKLALNGRLNTEFIVLDHHNHDPQRTIAAAQANLKMLKDRQKQAKHLKTAEQQLAFQKQYDWHQIYEQDEAIWERILAFLTE